MGGGLGLLLIEEFSVEFFKIPDILSFIDDATQVVESLNLPFLEYARVYQDINDPTKFRIIYEIGERSNLDARR